MAAQYAGEFDRAFKDYVHADFKWIVGSRNNQDLRAVIPWAGHIHQGKEGYIRLTTLLFSEFEALEFEPQHYTDAGDLTEIRSAARVYVEGHFTFRHRKTGKIADSDWIARFDLQGDRISGGQFYENTAGVAEARKAA